MNSRLGAYCERFDYKHLNNFTLEPDWTNNHDKVDDSLKYSNSAELQTSICSIPSLRSLLQCSNSAEQENNGCSLTKRENAKLASEGYWRELYADSVQVRRMLFSRNDLKSWLNRNHAHHSFIFTEKRSSRL